MTSDQWKALIGWVQGGGLLVVSGVPDINRLRSRPLVDLLPVVPAAIRTLPGLTGLRYRYGYALPTGDNTVVTGPLRTEAASLCVQGQLALVAAEPVGLGQVAFTAFDLMSPAARAWRGQEGLWQELLRTSRSEMRVGELLRAAYDSPGYYSTENRTLMDALAGLQATDAPSFVFIGLFLLTYIVCLVPLNYYLLKKRDRRELAWLTAPAIIILFTGGAYAVGRSVKGGQLYLRYARIVEGAANTTEFATYTVASVFSPQQARYDIAVPDTGALVTEVTQGIGGIETGPQEMVLERRTDATVISRAQVNMWDHRSFDVRSSTVLPGPLSASLTPLGGGRYRVRVTNGTPYTLQDCAISRIGGKQLLGAVRPGDSLSAVLLPAHATSQTGAGLASGWWGRQASTGRIQSALASVVSDGSGGADAEELLAFTGWYTDAAHGITLERERPRVEGVNLLVAHLPAPSATPVAEASAPRAPVATAYSLPPSAGGGGWGSAPIPSGAGTSSAVAMNQMAYSLAAQGRVDEALLTARRALNLAPTDGTILGTVGEMYQRKGDDQSAVLYFRRALARAPVGGASELHTRCASSLLHLGRKPEAIVQLRLAAAVTSDPWGTRAADTLRQMGVAR
jgi:hypothetical protein